MGGCIDQIKGNSLGLKLLLRGLGLIVQDGFTTQASCVYPGTSGGKDLATNFMDRVSPPRHLPKMSQQLVSKAHSSSYKISKFRSINFYTVQDLYTNQELDKLTTKAMKTCTCLLEKWVCKNSEDVRIIVLV